MKMVKSLLLGSAAGLVAVAGAQAADLPVKAKPVLYVKICDLYGAGFYYIPGTDICVKFGGFIRYQIYYKQGSAPTSGPYAGSSGRFTRLDGSKGTDFVQRTRAVITWDTRQSTSYGTLRTYWLLGMTQDTPGAANLYATRAFIQFAGFTFGKATSFFELHNGAAYSYMAPRFDPTTGDSGWMVAGYTAQFGNGVSATLAIEEPRRQIVANALAALPGTAWTNNQRGIDEPDIVANWRVSQTWGTAQVAVAAHNASAAYYGTLEGTGHPSDKWGWAALAAIVLTNAGCPGCVLSLQGVYSEGAVRYAGNLAGSNSPAYNKYGAGARLGVGWLADGVFGGPGTAVELTKVWSFQGAYEYVWNPNWKSSIYATYGNVDYNANATALICAGQTAATFLAASCNPDFRFLAVGHRTQWTPLPGLYMGVDVLYERLYTAHKGTATVGANGPKPAGVYNIQDMDNWSLTWRIHRDVVP